MKENKKRNIVWWILGGIIILGIGGFIIYKVVLNNKNNNRSSQTSPFPTTDLPRLPRKEEELEKYLLEKRLDLQKYFVFNLGKEVKPEKVKTNLLINGRQVNMDNGRLITPSLSNHLTKLTGATKEAICFLGKDTKTISDEWSEEKLDQKIRNGEQCYIIFDKTKVNNDTCNYFAKETGVFGTSFPTVCTLAMEDRNVFIACDKEEALDILAKDPAL